MTQKRAGIKYKKAWKSREEIRLKEIEKRRQMAFRHALKYGKMLCVQFGAEMVVLVGSVLQPERFNERSDIDLVVYESTTRTPEP